MLVISNNFIKYPFLQIYMTQIQQISGNQGYFQYTIIDQLHLLCIKISNSIISYKLFLLQMKSSHNLSFSCQENRVQYQYIPETYFITNLSPDGININQLYEKSLSSSFLAMPQIHPLSMNSSYSLEYDEPEMSRKRDSSRNSEIKVENTTKVQYHQPYSLMDLGLDYLLYNRKISTKNVLRNFGNAQTQYILHNNNAQKYLQSSLENKQQFQTWIRKFKLLNFIDYKNVWTWVDRDSSKQKLFKRIYKKLCWQFYEQQCIPYIFNSRLSLENKKSHLLQVYKMLNGIMNSTNFDGFKD